MGCHSIVVYVFQFLELCHNVVFLMSAVMNIAPSVDMMLLNNILTSSMMVVGVPTSPC